MATEKVVAQGCKVQIEIASVFTDIEAVFSIDGPGKTRAKIDFSDLYAEWKEKRKGQKDGGELTFKINYDPGSAIHAALYAAWDNDDPVNFKVIYSNTVATTESFAANVLDFKSTGMEVDGKLEAEVKLDVTGAITVT